MSTVDLSCLPQLDDPGKEQLYREFWAGDHPGAVLVSASQKTPGPRAAPVSDEGGSDDPFSGHLASEVARLVGRDWTSDDAVPSPTVPIGPTGTIATAFGATYDPGLDWTNQCLREPEEIMDLEPPRLGAGLTGRYLSPRKSPSTLGIAASGGL